MQVQGPGIVLCKYRHILDVGIGHVAQCKINDFIFAATGNGGLCYLRGQSAQSASLTPCQEHCYQFFFHACFAFPIRSDEKIPFAADQRKKEFYDNYNICKMGIR